MNSLPNRPNSTIKLGGFLAKSKGLISFLNANLPSTLRDKGVSFSRGECDPEPSEAEKPQMIQVDVPRFNGAPDVPVGDEPVPLEVQQMSRLLIYPAVTQQVVAISTDHRADVAPSSAKPTGYYAYEVDDHVVSVQPPPMSGDSVISLPQDH